MNNSAAVITLGELLPVEGSAGSLVVASLQMDSRAVTKGDLFIALPGYRQDGRDYIFEALKQGASAVLSEASGYSLARRAEFPSNVVWVESLKSVLGTIADRFYAQPSRDMLVFAVTGTNGKTTVSHLLARLCSLSGIKTAALGTLGYGHPDQLIALGNTTPDVVAVHKILDELGNSGFGAIAMEASSHGLDQGRLDSVAIRTAIITNVTRDHLDYHHTMDAYFQAKARLVSWSGLHNLILNQDDALVRQMASVTPPGVRVVRFSLKADADADVRLLASEYHAQGMTLTMTVGNQTFSTKTQLMGEFNIANILAATAALWVEDFDVEAGLKALEMVKPVPGRMECLPSSGANLPVVVVDYAHTPDALAQVLTSLKKHCNGRRLWCVFGCGGNRDKGKRPLMGQIAEELADEVVVTTDNPRDELASNIIDEICAGMKTPLSASVITVRENAIQFAINAADAGDVVLLAGKGHENYQEIAGERIFFSDHQMALNALRIKASDRSVPE